MLSSDNAATTIPHIANLGFDASTWEIYTPLLHSGTILCIDYLTILDLAALHAVFVQNNILIAKFTPALLKQCVKAIPDIVSRLHTLFVVGDHLDIRNVPHLRGLIQGDFINAYGPTENTTCSTIYHIGPTEDEYVNGVPIGWAINNSGAIVMDSRLRLVPPGVIGELVVTGDGLARGYTDASLNNDKFVWVTLAGKLTRAYRTGDRARYRPIDGQLEFLGRIDYQVKIRGHRIELAKVETALLRDKEVSDAVVIIKRHEEQEPELFGFVTLTPEESMQPDFQSDNAVDRLHIMLQSSLPSCMMPAKIKMLEKMPINSSGKIDRKALADMTADSVERRPCREMMPPRNDIEKAICEHFANILSEEVGITDNFFHLGGHSLMVMRLVSKINRLLQVVLSVSDIFAYPVVADLAERVCLLRGATPTPYVPIPRAKANGPVEQSFAQRRLWFLDRLYPDSTHYLMPFSTRFRGPLHVEALVLALLALEQRHEPLRTTFEHRDGLDVQHVHPYSSEMSRVRVVHIPNGDQEVFTKALQLEQSKPFDLENESGWRTTIYALSAEDHVLSITMHHIISDGWSVDILQRELALFYKAASQGLEPLSQVGLLPIQYQDFSVWQRHDLPQVAEQARQLEYWKQQLDGSQPAEMFCDKARPHVPSGNAEEHQFAIEESLY